MKHATSEHTTTRQSERTTQQDASAGPNAISMAPPAYGIDFVDRDLMDTAPVQRSAASSKQTLETPGVQQKNKTGLPDNLKTGIERLSGLSMDDVKVHYNSAKPAQLQALAYTQGTDIHVGPGQERHLPHEAWHVVQQKQGRVKPTMKMKGTAINDDSALELEAAVKGARAAREPSEGLVKQGIEQATVTPRRAGVSEGSENVRLNFRCTTVIQRAVIITGRTRLEEVWADPDARRGFKGYCAESWNVENYAFVEAADVWLNEPTRAKALTILRTYILTNARLQINISHQQRIEAERVLPDYIRGTGPPDEARKVIKTARKEVWGLLKQIFNGYVRTEQKRWTLSNIARIMPWKKSIR